MMAHESLRLTGTDPARPSESPPSPRISPGWNRKTKIVTTSWIRLLSTEITTQLLCMARWKQRIYVCAVGRTSRGKKDDLYKKNLVRSYGGSKDALHFKVLEEISIFEFRMNPPNRGDGRVYIFLFWPPIDVSHGSISSGAQQRRGHA